jgi:hypothetical protein
VKIIAIMGLRWIYVFVLLMVIVVHFSVCGKDFRFRWLEGDPCEDIPFPFGIRGTAESGFELKCEDGKATLLPSNNQSYPIQYISDGSVAVTTGILYKRCYNHDGSETTEDYSGLLNFEGTPYTIDITTQLVLFGCDESMIIRIDDYAIQPTCTTSCNGPADFNQTDDCVGQHCCRASFPPSYSKSYGVKRMQLKFAHISNSTSDRSFNIFANCSIAYVSVSIFLGDPIDFSHPYDPYNGSHEINLNWAIGNLSCEEARHQPDYRCKSNYSYCLDMFSLSGYNCDCGYGFKGNPYIVDGCSGTYSLKLIMSLQTDIS